MDGLNFVNEQIENLKHAKKQISEFQRIKAEIENYLKYYKSFCIFS